MPEGFGLTNDATKGTSLNVKFKFINIGRIKAIDVKPNVALCDKFGAQRKIFSTAALG